MFCNTTEDIQFRLEQDRAIFIGNVLLHIICCSGVPSNVLCFFILSRPHMQSSINCCLQFLAVYDCLFLSAWFVVMHTPGNRYVYIFHCITIACSIYTTLEVSAERFIAVCYPFAAKSFLSYKKTVFCNMLIIVFGVCINIPRLFLPDQYLGEGTDSVLHYHKRSCSELVPYFSDKPEAGFDFVKCFIWMEVIVGLCIPHTAIVAMNACIYRTVRKAESVRREMTQLQQKEINLYKSVMAVVIVFFICWTPMLIFKITSSFSILSRRMFFILYATSHPFLSLNSAANVIIYSALRKDFRKTFRDTFCSRRAQSGVNDVTIVTVMQKEKDQVDFL